MRTGAAVLALLTLAACGGTPEQEEALFCPRVDAVAGLDRLDLSYPGTTAPVRTSLDVVDAACVVEGDDLLVGTAMTIRLGPNRPPRDVDVPYTIVIESPDGMTGSRAEVAVVPAGSRGTVEYYEHRFPGLAARDDVYVRLLYALVPDDRELERLAREVPRP